MKKDKPDDKPQKDEPSVTPVKDAETAATNKVGKKPRFGGPCDDCDPDKQAGW